jgi:hypothetical protein
MRTGTKALARAVLAASLLLVVSLPSALAEEDVCEAEVNGKIMRKEEGGGGTDWTLEADVTSEAVCGDVLWELVVNERESDGSENAFRKVMNSHVRDGEADPVEVTYHQAEGTEVVNWEMHVVECKPCATEP